MSEQKSTDGDDQQKLTKDFVDKFEELAEKYKIENYVALINIDNTPIMLWRPKDLNIATRMAKNLHGQLHNMVMIEIGDITPPREY